jgi:hypothetical protein
VALLTASAETRHVQPMATPLQPRRYLGCNSRKLKGSLSLLLHLVHKESRRHLQAMVSKGPLVLEILPYMLAEQSGLDKLFASRDLLRMHTSSLVSHNL